MRFQTSVRRTGNGQYIAKTYSSLTGDVQVTADSSDEAVGKLRAEIRYRLEYCPCTSTEDDEIQIIVTGG